MTSNILADPILADAAHALSHLEHHTPDGAFLRARVTAVEDALARFEAALDDPLAQIDGVAREAYFAAIVLAGTLDAMPGDVASFRRTVDRMLDLFGRFVGPADRALRAQLTTNPCSAATFDGPRIRC